MNLLRHGRRTCHARSPECGDCALLAHVPDRLQLIANPQDLLHSD